jgi:hypothetical protein
MAISSEQLAALLTSLEALPSKGDSDPRRAPRTKLHGTATITPCGSGNLLAGADQRKIRLADVSSRGVGILSDVPMPKGQQFLLHLPQNAGTANLLCQVVHCRLTRPNVYAVGAEFICTATAPAVEVAPSDQELEKIRKSILE